VLTQWLKTSKSAIAKKLEVNILCIKCVVVQLGCKGSFWDGLLKPVGDFLRASNTALFLPFSVGNSDEIK